MVLYSAARPAQQPRLALHDLITGVGKGHLSLRARSLTPGGRELAPIEGRLAAGSEGHLYDFVSDGHPLNLYMAFSVGETSTMFRIRDVVVHVAYFTAVRGQEKLTLDRIYADAKSLYAAISAWSR